jgi:hypothetical protein
MSSRARRRLGTVVTKTELPQRTQRGIAATKEHYVSRTFVFCAAFVQRRGTHVTHQSDEIVILNPPRR